MRCAVTWLAHADRAVAAADASRPPVHRPITVQQAARAAELRKLHHSWPTIVRILELPHRWETLRTNTRLYLECR